MTLLDSKSLAADSYVYGYPLVLSSVASEALAIERNLFFSIRDEDLDGATGVSGQIVSSVAWLDVGAEPIVLALPDSRRYCAVSLFDGWTNLLQSVGLRITSAAHRTIVISRHERTARDMPSNFIRVVTPGALVRIGVRIAQYGKSDADAAMAFQRHFELLPLSRYLAGERAQEQLATDGYSQKELVNLVDAMSGMHFFSLMNKALRDNAPATVDSSSPNLLQCVVRLLSEDRSTLDHGARLGKSHIQSYRANGMEIGSWSLDVTCEPCGLRDHVRRAALTRARLNTDDPQDYVRLIADRDARGEPLDGRFQYSLTFHRSSQPPSRAPWLVSTRPSLCECSSQTEPDASGTTVFHFARTRPANASETQFLPVRPGPFAVVLHVFWPMEEILSGAWLPPSIDLIH